jgi:hypothetical protein
MPVSPSIRGKAGTITNNQSPNINLAKPERFGQCLIIYALSNASEAHWVFEFGYWNLSRNCPQVKRAVTISWIPLSPNHRVFN